MQYHFISLCHAARDDIDHNYDDDDEDEDDCNEICLLCDMIHTALGHS